MRVQQISLPTPSSLGNGDVAVPFELLETLLAFYLHNGQICDELPILEDETGLTVEVLVPEPSSLNEKNGSEYVRRQLAKIRETAGEILVRDIGKAVESLEPCSCQEPESYILYTTFLDVDSPLRCGRCFMPVPLYRITVPERDDHQPVVSWAAAYRACDRLFMHSGALERAAYRELSKPDSALSREGLVQCRGISETTGKPVYYYLMHYYSENRRREAARRCPSCGGAWLLPEPSHRLFDFRCETCHLLSNISPLLGPH